MQYKYWMVHAVTGGAPNKRYLQQEQAASEAKRLATVEPGRRFCVLEVVSCFEVPKPQPVEIPVVVQER